VVVDGEGTDQQGNRFVAVEIVKVFRDPPDPQTYVLPSVNLSFVQTAPDEATASRIYIADEMITNLTGVSWTDFHWFLACTDAARFNRELTNATGEGGWQVQPFQACSWTYDQGLCSEAMTAYVGTVPSGSTFFPGVGLGNLVIDVVGLSAPGPAGFMLKELPTTTGIPEPASLLLLGAGALVLLRGRRTRR